MAATSRHERGINSLHEELIKHPHWCADPQTLKLEQNSYAIVKEPKPNTYSLRWLNQRGEMISIPFCIIDEPTFQWCFWNGQANTFTQLDQMILDIFKHFKEEK